MAEPQRAMSALGYQLDIEGGEHPIHRGRARIAPVARRTDPETSHDAAASVDPRRMRTLHRAQLVLLSVEPACHTELWERYNNHRRDLGWPIVSESGFRTRVAELVGYGYVEASGRKAVLDTGRHSIIWRITPDGREELDRVPR